MRHERGEVGVKMGTVLVEADEGGAAQQQWHRSASECAEAPGRGAVKPKEEERVAALAWACGCARLVSV